MANNINESIALELLSPKHQENFLTAANRSKTLHSNYVQPPLTPEEFTTALSNYDQDRNYSFIVIEKTSNDIAGMININEVVKGNFNSGYLGYYAFEPFERKGYMTAAMKLVMCYAKDHIGLHRLEANIQPDNIPSINFVKKLGFVKEGYSKDYLIIDGKYCDHERWAILL